MKLGDANRNVENPRDWHQSYDIKTMHGYIPFDDTAEPPKNPDGSISWTQSLGNVVNPVMHGLKSVKDKVFGTIMLEGNDNEAVLQSAKSKLDQFNQEVNAIKEHVDVITIQGDKPATSTESITYNIQYHEDGTKSITVSEVDTKKLEKARVAKAVDERVNRQAAGLSRHPLAGAMKNVMQLKQVVVVHDNLYDQAANQLTGQVEKTAYDIQKLKIVQSANSLAYRQATGLPMNPLADACSPVGMYHVQEAVFKPLPKYGSESGDNEHLGIVLIDTVTTFIEDSVRRTLEFGGAPKSIANIHNLKIKSVTASMDFLMTLHEEIQKHGDNAMNYVSAFTQTGTGMVLSEIGGIAGGAIGGSIAGAETGILGGPAGMTIGGVVGAFVGAVTTAVVYDTTKIQGKTTREWVDYAVRKTDSFMDTK